MIKTDITTLTLFDEIIFARAIDCLISELVFPLGISIGSCFPSSANRLKSFSMFSPNSL
jgi:hypothetical protein